MHAERSISTLTNICRAIAVTGFWAHNPQREVSHRSPMITSPSSAYPSTSATPRNSRAFNHLLHTAVHLVKGYTPCSLKLKYIIEKLGWYAECSIADGEVEAEPMKNLHSQAKDLSAASAKDCCQLTDARVITQKDIVCSSPFTKAVAVWCT
jgi:hypothetical protein